MVSVTVGIVTLVVGIIIVIIGIIWLMSVRNHNSRLLIGEPPRSTTLPWLLIVIGVVAAIIGIGLTVAANKEAKIKSTIVEAIPAVKGYVANVVPKVEDFVAHKVVPQVEDFVANRVVPRVEQYIDKAIPRVKSYMAKAAKNYINNVPQLQPVMAGQ